MDDRDKLTGFPSIDRPWLKYFTEEDLALEVPECTIYEYIYRNNRDYPKDKAINYYGHKISYGKLFSEVEKCAKALKEIGIKKGDCVTLCSAGVPEAVYLVLACSRIGAIANFLNPMFSTEQMAARINDTEARWIFILDVMYKYVEGTLAKSTIENVVIIPATNSFSPVLSKVLFYKSTAHSIFKESRHSKIDFISWNQFLLMGDGYKGSIDEPYEPDSPAVMVYSSGTTGASKGILLTNIGINTTITNYWTKGFSSKRGEAMLQIIPVWFSSGMVLSVLMPLSKGVTVILEPKFNNGQFAEDLKKFKPNMTLATTNMWLGAVDICRKIDLSNMKYPVTGGEKVNPADERRIQAFLNANGCNSFLLKGYGMCELGSTISTSAKANGYKNKPLGEGFPMLGASVAAFNVETDEELPYYEHGEIRCYSPARMKGYYKNPKATEEFFKTDVQGRKWGCTGDIGYVDEDGEVFILGRAADSFKLDTGEMVFLFDIEEVINKDPSINECKVIDAEVNGKKVLVAHVVLREGTDSKIIVTQRILSACRENLPDYMTPNYIKFRQDMPINKNGKRDIIAIRKDVNDLVRLYTQEE